MRSDLPSRKGRPLLVRHKSFLFGVACIGGLAWLLSVGRRPADWEQIAHDRFEERDLNGAIDAATAAIDRDPQNYDLLFLRADAESQLGMPDRAIEDVDLALQLSPKNDRFLLFKVFLLSTRDRTDDAIALVDGALERAPKNVTLIATAARLRLTLVDQLRGKLLARISPNHPNRLLVPDLIDAWLAAPTLESEERARLVDPLPGSGLRDEIDTDLVRAWKALHDADAKLGDLRVTGIPLAQAGTVRAAIDIRLGRLVRAKEDLQSLLAGPSVDRATRRQALELLAEVLRRVGANVSRVATLRQLIDLDGGADVAPMFRLADSIEAMYFDARERPSERPAFLAAADQHLLRWRGRDVRSLGYRGLAALEFENKPDLAIDLLSEVFDVLRLQKDKDPSIAEPARARAFLTGLAAAARAANRPQLATAPINALIELAPQDLEMLTKRAESYAAGASDGAAAHDLLEALKIGPRSPEMFRRWIDIVAELKDNAGRTPRERARIAVKDAIDAREEFFRKLGEQTSSFVPLGARPKTEAISRTLAGLGDKAVQIAGDPVVAWFMAEEYGRRGMTVEARNFLGKASAGLPGVLELTYRLALLRLDLGLYQSAAEDFEVILERDPTDSDAAEAAFEAWRLAGDLARARRVRARCIASDPEGAGMEECLRSAVENGDAERALRTLAPVLARPPAQRTLRETALLGHVALAAGAGNVALATLATIAREDETADTLRDRLLVTGMTGRRLEFDACADRFVSLARLLPAPEVQDMIGRLESGGRYAEAASIARRVAVRYPEDVELLLVSRAAVDSFLAGDPEPLRQLRDRSELGPDLSNDVVRACFGLTLRENGAPAAAKYLQRAREFTPQRDWAALPTAAAFALTPFHLDVTTFLSRYESSLKNGTVPLDDAVLYFVTRLRDPAQRKAPDVEPGADGELLWLKSAAERREHDTSITELYLNFLLFKFAGRGFEEEAHRIADRLARFDIHAATPARHVAGDIEITKGPVLAAAWILPHYQADQNDVRNFQTLGRLLILSDPTGDALAHLGLEGRARFPNRPDPDLFGATAAARRKQLANARECVERAVKIAKTPDEVDQALLGFLHLSDVFHDPDVSSDLARRIAAAKSRHPFLRDFLVRRYSGHTELDREVLAVMTPLIDDDPTFFEGAAVLARSLGDGEKDAELTALAERLTNVAPGSPEAGTAGDALAAVVRTLVERKQEEAALALANAALLADPSNIELRKLRVDRIAKRDGRPATITDLRLLTALAPEDVDLLLRCAETLLAENGARIDGVTSLAALLEKRAPNDPRLFALRAWIAFRADDLKSARQWIGRALSLDLASNAYRYATGVFAWLDGDAKVAKDGLSGVAKDYEFWQRAREILGLVNR